MGKKYFWLAILILNLIVAPAIFFSVSQALTKKLVMYSGVETSALADYGQVAGFDLTESNGKVLSLSDLKGAPWVASFIFTHCAGQCPTVSLKMGSLQESLPSSVKLVSFSVDPGRDTPKKLSLYAEKYNATENRWFFVTGDKPAVDKLLQSFHVNDTENPNIHSLRFALVDGDGRIRGYYDSSDENALRSLVEDTKVLLSEKGAEGS